MEGAREAGAEVEMVNLYDRNLNYKGCMSCFACKVKGGKKGVCSFPDDLKPVMEKAVEADVLVCGSPVYCGYPTAGLRAFMERLVFPAVNYSDFSHPVISKPKANNYHILMDTNAQQLGMFGPTEILYSFDNYQFNDYSRYDAAMLPEERKARMRETQFPQDLQNAYELGKRLVEEILG